MKRQRYVGVSSAVSRAVRCNSSVISLHPQKQRPQRARKRRFHVIVTCSMGKIRGSAAMYSKVWPAAGDTFRAAPPARQVAGVVMLVFSGYWAGAGRNRADFGR